MVDSAVDANLDRSQFSKVEAQEFMVVLDSVVLVAEVAEMRLDLGHGFLDVLFSLLVVVFDSSGGGMLVWLPRQGRCLLLLRGGSLPLL